MSRTEIHCDKNGDHSDLWQECLLCASASDAADIVKFRALAKRAAEFDARNVQRWEDRDAILDELVEMHKESTDG
jgi:hypothetical protein